MSFVRSNGVTLWVQHDCHGSELTIVFVNSLGSDYRIWDDVMPDLVDFDCLRYDLRGHGLSDCPDTPCSIADHTKDLKHLLGELKIRQPIILIGISVGGMIAMDFAAHHPETVKALVLLDTLPKIGTSEMWNERINTIREHGISHLADAILARWFAPNFISSYRTAYAGFYNMLTRMPVAGYIGTCEAIRDADLTDTAKAIACPTLVLAGAEDQSTPSELVRGLTQIIADSRFVEVENAGHLPCVENPTATAMLIHTFIKEVC